MEEIIQYLFNASDNQECYYDYPAVFMFIGKFQISISFDTDEGFDNKFFYIDDIQFLKKFASNLSIKEFKISILENLDKREDGGKWDEKEEKIYFNERPISIANTTLQLVKKLYEIGNSVVKNYNFITNDPSQGYCKGESNYIGEILVNEEQIKLSTVEKIVYSINMVEINKLATIYLPSYYKHKIPKNNFSPQFLNTNTKVRRLGYLKLFFKFINDKKKIPESFINKKFEEFCLPFTSQLNDLSNNKGVIQNLKGKSAEPYVLLLKEMGLITTINSVVVPTKLLKTYLCIREDYSDEIEQTFVLDKIDKIFFLEVILKTDFLYSTIILEFIVFRETSTSQELIKSFQGLLLEKIKKLLNQITNRDKKSASLLRDIEKRVLLWKKPEVYLEHIIMPRINWFADLDLILLNGNNINVNENSKRLFTELNSWIDIGAEYVADSSDYLEKFYPHIYAKSYFDGYGEYPQKEIINILVEEYMSQSFRLFKTLAPNRVTSSQAFTFTKYNLYFKNGFSASESYLKRVLEEKLSNKYIYKFQPRYGDGYIQKIL